MSAEAPLRIAIVEDNDEIRFGLQALLDDSPGFETAGSWPTMESALREIGAPLPDLALVDIQLPGIDGIEGTRRLRERFPTLPVVVLTVFADDRRIFEALCAGACGYLLKKTPRRKLLEGLREAKDGGAPMSPSIARRVIELFRAVHPGPASGTDLTPHETRVLKLFADGHNYRTASEALGVSASTVSYHLQQIYKKLEVHGSSEAVAKALRHGLIR
jgi:DNA-binding NarL/FixJ family response regulator